MAALPYRGFWAKGNSAPAPLIISPTFPTSALGYLCGTDSTWAPNDVISVLPKQLLHSCHLARTLPAKQTNASVSWCPERHLKGSQYEETHRGAGKERVPWQLIHLTETSWTEVWDRVRWEPNLAL